MPASSDLVHETTSSTGTGNLATSSVNGKRSFNTAFGTGGTNIFDYFISNQAAAEWEIGTGHLSAATTLVRDTVVISSNANALVNFSAGTKDIVNDLPSARQNAPIFEQYSADAVDEEATFNKSRNATMGAHTIVQSGDNLGTIRFNGSNGTAFESAALILGVVDGTPGASADMPGRIVFQTSPDGSATPTETFRIPADKWVYSTDAAGNINYMPRTYRLNSQHSISSATATAVTGLQAALVAGTYVFDYYLIVRSSTAADGLKFGVNYTGSATSIVVMLRWPDTGVTAALGAIDDTANATTGQIVAYSVANSESTGVGVNLNTGTTGVAATASNLYLRIEGIAVLSDAGNLELWHASESTNATTVEVGSSLILHRTA